MPDHLHLLLVGESEDADLRVCVKRFKQLTGFAYKKEHQQRLWQHGYYERVLRDDEATLAVVRYILENPIRAGLARRLGEYAFAGCDVFSWHDLSDVWELHEQT
jgi:putative transposase